MGEWRLPGPERHAARSARAVDAADAPRARQSAPQRTARGSASSRAGQVWERRRLQRGRYLTTRPRHGADSTIASPELDRPNQSLPPLEKRPPDGETKLRVHARFGPRRFEVEDEQGGVHGRVLDSGEADVYAVVHDMAWLCGVRRTRWGWSGVVLEQASDRLVARYVPRLLAGRLPSETSHTPCVSTTTGRGWQLQDVNKAVIWTMRPVKVNARMKHSDDGDPIVTEVELGARGPGQENTVFTILLGVWITALEEESRSRSRPGPGPNV